MGNDLKKRDVLVYAMAREFVLNHIGQDFGEHDLDKYLIPSAGGYAHKSIQEIYMRLVESIQNANSKANVIGKSMGGVSALTEILSDFDPATVAAHYGQNWTALLEEIVREVKPKGQIRRETRSLWPQFCCGVLSGAQYLSGFENGKAFVEMVEQGYHNRHLRYAIPLMIQARVHGFGLALACDFLKELGFLEYGKPDVHIRDIFIATGLERPSASDIDLLEAIGRVAEHVGVTAFHVDKLFWLIGSGDFGYHRHLGQDGRFAGMKKTFIAQAA